ncbi:22349_t:CDS:1 [Dentiscutata erythropus]|uniref:22349_t:CDS:1 n=1 Tax=Dentiscutata erythropus TaxID=1348616 RepID=A0A9N9IJI4_9GLOM|nr:22349_t:CDS:1 [Dentiscutata erythropus]
MNHNVHANFELIQSSQQEYELYIDELGISKINLGTMEITHSIENIENYGDFNVIIEVHAFINALNTDICVDKMEYRINNHDQSRTRTWNINNNNMPVHVVNRVYVRFFVFNVNGDEQNDHHVKFNTLTSYQCMY